MKSGPARRRFRVHPAVQRGRALVDNLEEKSGTAFSQWVVLARKRQAPDRRELVLWLRDQGLGPHHAMLVAAEVEGEGRELWDAKAYLARADEYVDEQYAGKKSTLRPIYEALAEMALSLGDDVGLSPCKTIVPVYRNYVIAEIKPATLTRVDFGLALADTPVRGRLVDTGGLENRDRITRRIPIEKVEQVDAVVRRWLVKAYELDG